MSFPFSVYIIHPPHFVVLPLSQGEKVDGVQMTEYRVQSTDYRLQSTEYRLQITDYRLQITDDGLQRATSTCRDTECRVRQSKYDIVDVSDTACRVHT